MAGLRVFVSSTCYDLSVIRSQLRIFIQDLGHEPSMSDYSDLLYYPRIHTHTSCVDEVASADVVDSHELRWWLLSQGSALQVLAPETLRDWFADQAVRQSLAYQT